MKFGGTDYRDGALERLRESEMLLVAQKLAGSIYLAGRAVECMLRALIWRRDVDVQRGRKSLDTGHDLVQLLLYMCETWDCFEPVSEMTALRPECNTSDDCGLIT